MAPVPPLRRRLAGGARLSQQINLFDARFRRQKQHFSAVTLLQALAALFAFALAIQSLYAWQNRDLQQTLAAAERRVVGLQEQTLHFAREVSGQGGPALADEIVRVEERVRARRELLATLQSGAGAHAEAFSPFLAALARRTMDGVWLTGVDIGAESRSLVLRGRVLEAALVPAYLRGLEREEVFSGRAVHELRLARGAPAGGHVGFSLTIPLGKGPS